MAETLEQLQIFIDTLSATCRLPVCEIMKKDCEMLAICNQMKYNEEHGIVPKTIIKEIRDLISNEIKDETKEKMSKKEFHDACLKLEQEMRKAAKELDFEKAMQLRDILFEMKANNKEN